MATVEMAKTSAGQAIRQPGRSWRTKLLAGAALVAAVLVAWNWAALTARARADAAYAARIGCSCHFVAGRALAECEADLADTAGRVSLSADAEAKSVTARALLAASETAIWRDGEGCILQPWDD